MRWVGDGTDSRLFKSFFREKTGPDRAVRRQKAGINKGSGGQSVWWVREGLSAR
jgi:hypothetical protein